MKTAGLKENMQIKDPPFHVIWQLLLHVAASTPSAASGDEVHYGSGHRSGVRETKSCGCKRKGKESPCK